MENIKILISGDSNYYKFLCRIEQNIFDKFGSYPVIYDLGLTEVQKSSLKSRILTVDVLTEYQEYNGLGFIKATHKPNCILDFLNNNNEDCLYLDADILLSRKFTKDDLYFKGYDIAVTPRHVEERYEKLLKNGYINSGVMFFRNNKNSIQMIKKWIKECQNKNTTDQLAMSNLLTLCGHDIFSKKELLLNETRVCLLDAQKYNDISLSSGLILHYKNAGRFSEAFKRYKFDYWSIRYNLHLRFLYFLILRIKKKLISKIK
jgi:hypothetical protein